MQFFSKNFNNLSLKMINGAGKERMASYCFDAPLTSSPGAKPELASLHALQNCIKFTPLGPNEDAIPGFGAALPALTLKFKFDIIIVNS